MGLFKKKKKDENAPEIPEPPVFFPNVNLEKKNIATNISQEQKPSLLDSKATTTISSVKKDGDMGAANAPIKSQAIPQISQQASYPESTSAIPELPPQKAPQLVAPIIVSRVPSVQKQEVEKIQLSSEPISFIQKTEKIVTEEPLSSDSSYNYASYSSPSNASKKDSSDSIFIRIDKFNLAKKDMDEINKDIKQVHQVVKKINNVKSKEDEEMVVISKMLEEIKDKMQGIDSEIFNRI